MPCDEVVHLSVVIPAYNEALRLSPTLESVFDYLRAQPWSAEVLVVDDGSTDETAQLVTSRMDAWPELKLLQYAPNRGKGHAVRHGMTHATGRHRLFMDADNSTTIDHLDRFLPLLKQGYDVVIGSRDMEGAQIEVHQPWLKEKLGDLGNLWIQALAAPGIRDTQAGFKVFSGQAADVVFPLLTLDRWGFDVEAIAVARHHGFRVLEQPIRWANDQNSKVSAGAYLEVLQEVVQVRLNLWRGRYDRRPRPHPPGDPSE